MGAAEMQTSFSSFSDTSPIGFGDQEGRGINLSEARTPMTYAQANLAESFAVAVTRGSPSGGRSK